MLPRWIYKQLFQPYGWHLPKREEYKESFSSYSHHGYGWGLGWEGGGSGYFRRDHSGGFSQIGGRRFGSDERPVSGGDFRYWFGSRASTSGFGMCRCCRIQLWVPELRNEHMRDRQKKCSKYITEALDLLKRDKKCVICDGKTVRMKWGVPLCSTQCDSVWMFDGWDSKGVEALALALEKAGANVAEYAKIMGYEL